MSRYIDLNKALSFPYANGEYDKKNANQDFIKGCESYKEWLESLPAAETKTVRYWHEDLQRAGRPHKVIEVE